MRLTSRSLSIRTTLLLAIAAAVVLPAIAIWHLEQRLTRDAQEPLIRQSRQAVLAVTASALVEPLWTIDPQRTAAVARRALDEPHVLAVTLVESRPLAAPVVLSRPGADTARGVPLTTPILYEGARLGDLELRFEPDQVDQAIAERRLATLLLAGLQVLIGSLVLIGILNRRVLGPLLRLKRQASDIASRNDVAPMAWHHPDEINQLGRHLNLVHQQIDDLFDRLEQQKADLVKIALHDTLTGLPNRTHFQKLLEQTLAQAKADNERVALLFVDLDRFKSINDTVGHAAGDSLLLAVAARMRERLRATDLLCRYSGDEFVVLVRHVGSWDELAARTDRLLEAIEQPVRLAWRDITVSASIGITLYPDDAADAEALVRNADMAMYASKNLGRARYTFFRSDLNSQLHQMMNFEEEFKRALQTDQFVLHYQPQVASDSGLLLGCEALIRWLHPQRGTIAPLQFIGAAEQCGLISDLGAWTIRHACRQIAQWKQDGVPFGSVAVNVSALEFRHHRLIDTLTRAMQEHDVRPHELEIEITESVLMTDTDATQRIVEDLHRLGLRLAIDDFGTGYSSLAYLKRLRPSKVKIDRSFVRDLPDCEDDRVLVQAVVQLASAMGIQVVAEGVETDPQAEFLRRSGCQVLQGYLISRPKPADAFADLACALGATREFANTAVMDTEFEPRLDNGVRTAELAY